MKGKRKGRGGGGRGGWRGGGGRRGGGALGVALGPLSRPRGPLGALRVRLLAKGLQVNDVALAALVQAGDQIDRHAQAQGEPQRPLWKVGVTPEEPARDRF